MGGHQPIRWGGVREKEKDEGMVDSLSLSWDVLLLPSDIGLQGWYQWHATPHPSPFSGFCTWTGFIPMTVVFLVLQLEKCKSWDFSAVITAEPIPVINLHLHFSLSHILLALFLWRMLTNNRATESEGISRILRECYQQCSEIHQLWRNFTWKLKSTKNSNWMK